MQIPMEEVYAMKLYNIYYLCQNLIDIFDATRFRLKNHSEYYINYWDEYRKALNALAQIPMFQEKAEKIFRAVPAYVIDDEEPVVSDSAKVKISELNDSIVVQMDTIINLYESMELGNTKNGIDIKIPNCTNLDDYIYYLKEINFIFTQCPYLLHENEKLRFSNVDVGSNWISFVIELSAGTALTCYILNNIATLLDKALILKSHFNNIKEQKAALKIANKREELAEEELKIFTKLEKYYMDEIISQLEEEIEPHKDGEERGKTEKTLEKLITLLDKGVEIYAALDTPKDIQVLFPEIGETKKLPDKILNFIEDKNLHDKENE